MTIESKVKLSTFSLILTYVLTGVLIVGLSILLWNDDSKAIPAAFILILLLVLGFIYAPLSIAVNDKNVTVKSFLRNHRIPISEIESVELFQPTMGSIRLAGSGGFMGYWGLFREGGIGKYIAYYGKASDCFLIIMKNGVKYVIGCENPSEIVDFINSGIQ